MEQIFFVCDIFDKKAVGSGLIWILSACYKLYMNFI
jgi:hypothetical protein